jgi:hypothetical protein
LMATQRRARVPSARPMPKDNPCAAACISSCSRPFCFASAISCSRRSPAWASDPQCARAQRHVCCAYGLGGIGGHRIPLG